MEMNLAEALADRVMAMPKAGGRPYFIAICGWADTGKSTLAASLCSALRQRQTSADWISTDAFLIERTERNRLGVSGYNPASIDADDLASAVRKLSNGGSFSYHPYDNRSGRKTGSSRTIDAQAVVIIEGIHAFHPALSTHLDYRIFIDADDDVLRTLRINGNRTKRGMELDDAVRRVDHEFAEFRQFIAPQKSLADALVSVSSDYSYAFAQ
jgi:uridine kinase